MKHKSLIPLLLLVLCVSILLCGCGKLFGKKSSSDDTQIEVDMKTIEGVYSESLAHRGVLQLSARDSSNVDVVINWPGSAFENAHWEMSGAYDPEKQAIVYNDATLIEQTFDETGSQSDRQVSANGSGSFSLSGSNLVWTDDNAYIGSDPVTFSYTMSLIQGKYKMFILYTLACYEIVRFNEMKKYIGEISYKTLSSTLKELEADGLIHRKEYPQIPPKVEYSLSEKGKSLIPILGEMCDWGEMHRA